MIFAKYSEKSLEFFLGFTINNNVHNKTQQRKYSDSNYQFFFFLVMQRIFLVIDDVMELHYGLRSNVKMQFFTSWGQQPYRWPSWP